MIKATLRLLTCFALAFGALTIHAQTTYNFQVPVSCAEFAANPHCTVQAITPAGPNGVVYSPTYNGRFNIIQFAAGDTVLSDLGTATVTSFTPVTPTCTATGIPNRQGYRKVCNYTGEATTFAGTDATDDPYTGSTTVNYTTTTACCSSGRGASQKTTWTITGGSVTVSE